jgi:hypothetical protein
MTQVWQEGIMIVIETFGLLVRKEVGPGVVLFFQRYCCTEAMWSRRDLRSKLFYTRGGRSLKTYTESPRYRCPAGPFGFVWMVLSTTATLLDLVGTWC